MHELLVQLLTYARGMWRYRWYALLVAWVVCLAGWAFVYTLPEEYESRARIQINTQSLLDPLLRGLAVRPDIETQLQMMTQTLLSRSNIQKVVAKLDPNRAPRGSDNSPDPSRASVTGDSAEVVPFNTDALVGRLQGKITIQSPRTAGRPFGGNQIYHISYNDKDPRMAHRVVQALLNVLVEETLDVTRADTDTAQRFLNEQIGDYEARLTTTEQRLAEFRKKNAGMMEGERVDYYSRLRAAKDELEATRAKLSIAINRREELKRQLEGDEPVFGIMSPAGTFRGGQTSSFDARIQEHQRQLDELLLKYTANHPEVIALRAMIGQLEDKKQQELQAQRATRGGTSVGPLELNPVIQRIHIALNETEVEIAALRVQLADQESKVNELAQRVDEIPEVEAQFARLNRDYEITKKQYEALKERLELARLGERADDQGSGKAIRVLDAPAVPRTPAGGRRPLYLTAVLLAGLLGGAGLAFVLQEIRPVFSNSKALREATGLPVLGAVSMKFAPAQQRKLRLQLASFVFATLLLVGGYGATVVFQDIGVRIAHRLVA